MTAAMLVLTLPSMGSVQATSAPSNVRLIPANLVQRLVWNQQFHPTVAVKVTRHCHIQIPGSDLMGTESWDFDHHL